jgi:LuxR family maltose regulon positive regulatory protein
MPLLVRVRAGLARGGTSNLAEISAVLAQCRTLAAARNLQLKLIEIDALDALCTAATGQFEEALGWLARSVNAAAAGGLQRILLDLGPPLQPLLQELRDRGVAPAFVSQVLAAGQPKPELAPATLPPQVPSPGAAAGAPAGPDVMTKPAAIQRTGVGGPDMLLTNRELDVLLLLAQRLSDKEIAQALVVSPRTVKKHAASIYQKLHVDNRRAAVSAARAQGILPPR